jgi:ribosomal protein L2
MALVKVKPTSAGRRGVVKVVRADLHKGKPLASLTEKKIRGSGRNNAGRITTRHKGGGHKQHYRIVDFKRNKDGIAAKVERLEYDPNRTAHLALLCYIDGERRYIIAPKGVAVGAQLMSGAEAPIRPGNTLPLRNIPVGTTIHCVEMQPGKGAQLARAAGTSVQLLAREVAYAQLRLRSGEIRRVLIGLPCNDRRGGQRREQSAPDRQGWRDALARRAADRAWRGDEPGRPSAWWRRGTHRDQARSGQPLGSTHQGLPHAQEQAHRFDDRCPQVPEVRGSNVPFTEKRPVCRRPSVEEDRSGAGYARQETDQDLVAALDDPAGVHRPDDRRAQRQAACARVHQREHGRPQARRVRADTDLQGPRGGQENLDGQEVR